MKAMETIEDLIEEGKVRTVWWALCVFIVTYFLSHTSTSMWMNVPVAIVAVSVLRILSNEVEFHWKVKPMGRKQTYLSHLEKKQLSVDDSRLCSSPPPERNKKIDSPVVESAINDFIDKLLKEFVIDLWYSEISADKEAPEHIRSIIMDALGEIAVRVKEINLVDLLTRDIIDLVGDHLDLFRRNQAAIGADVMRTLSTEQRDNRLKDHLMATKELHPALLSPESEYKVLQRLIGGVLTVVLRPREAQCPIVRTIAREIVTCLVVQPILDFASPVYINELIESVFLALKEYAATIIGGDKSNNMMDNHAKSVENCNANMRRSSTSINQRTNMATLRSNSFNDEHVQSRHGDWGRVLEAATQRRTEILTPENLENMWTKGRNYKKKEYKTVRGVQEPVAKGLEINTTSNSGKELIINNLSTSTGAEDKSISRLAPSWSPTARLNDTGRQFIHNVKRELSIDGKRVLDDLVDSSIVCAVGKSPLKRSNSTSDLLPEPDRKKSFTEEEEGSPIISEFYGPDFAKPAEEYKTKSVMDTVPHGQGPHAPKLRCRVIGAYFEKLGSKSFAVYAIAVTDAENKTWFVNRRYRNFERLHRQLKDIPNYALHLPPKRIFSSSTEDAFVHQRCIQLDKYLRDVLSIPNVAEQHEVWDFLSVSSKNYSFGKSSPVMKTLAVHVDDAVDDIVRQFKVVSDGLVQQDSVSSPKETFSSELRKNLSWNASDDMNKQMWRQNTAESGISSLSDIEESDKAQMDGWHSDNELNSRHFPPRVIYHGEPSRSLEPEINVEAKRYNSPGSHTTSNNCDDPVGMPPEWTPPNVSVPLLNLVDKIFLLNRRGWLRRQVFWISRQILQLVMEDAIDDFLLRQIHWLRRGEVIAQGIRLLKDILWPGGTFFLKLKSTRSAADDHNPSPIPFQFPSKLGGIKISKPKSFEQEFEATRRANAVKKILFDEVPSALVSLIGQKQYRRCARDMYYFLQSTICIKQLTFATLELLLITVFPELRELVLDIRERMHISQN